MRRSRSEVLASKQRAAIERNTTGGRIYLITCRVNGRHYIGRTAEGVEQRWFQHAHSGTDLAKDIHQYGRSAFRVRPIDCAETWPELLAKERMWIKALAGNSLYNRPLGRPRTCPQSHNLPQTSILKLIESTTSY